MKTTDYIIYDRVVGRRDAVLADFPNILLPEIREYLLQSGIRKLYSHQAEMFETAMEGKNIVITTSTASGKTLSFLLPVLQEILKNPLTRAIFVYPTKALAADQYRAILPILEFFGKNKISAGVYDGDTPVNERSRIRNSANIILTNPEMLNSAFLPHHSKYSFNFIFSNLKFVVIDELHSYRGAFGSHFANIFRRLNRVCKYYNSAPQFLCSSATIANPVELAENVCSQEFVLIDRDGSPAPQKQYYIIQPPIVKDTDYRVSVASISADLIPELTYEKRSFIAFCKSRKAVEVILKEARDKLKYDGILGQDLSDLISGYRGGYTPLERKEIENKMVSGALRGLISTNALELGIDIGKVDTTVLTGYPNTRASFWQQSGRAGRSGKSSDTFLVLDNLPFDQYIAIDPDWLFETGSENAVIDKNNLFIQLAHIRAASAELPLSLDDIAVFPDMGEIVPVLLRVKELKSENGKFIWSGKDFPAGDYSLRNMDKQRYTLKNHLNDSVITEMDEMQAFSEIHDGAIYIHDGQSYQILKLDLASKTADAKPIDENYYTEPFISTAITVIKSHKEKPVGRIDCHFGDVNVNNVVAGYKKLQFHNHQNLGYQELNPTLSKAFETEGFWIELPKNVVDVYTALIPFKGQSRTFWKSYFGGLGFALQNSTMMTTMTTKEDIGSATLLEPKNNELVTSICIYDMFVGGLGYSDKAFEVAEMIINNAIKMVSSCKCKDGCPACVGDYKLDKNIVLWGLNNIFKEIEPPQNIKIPEAAKQTMAQKPFNMDTIADNWNEFTSFIKSKGEYLSGFLASISSVKTEKKKLILILNSEFYKTWLLEGENKLKLINMINEYVNMPAGFDLDVEIENGESEDVSDKLARRYADLTK